MDLIELRQTVRRWWVHGLLTFLVIAIACMFALPGTDKPFTARSTLLVTPRPEQFESISTGVLRVILPNLLVVARSRDLRDEVAQSLGPIGAQEIATEATFLRDTGVLTLTVRSASYEGAIRWSIALAEAVADRYADDHYVSVEVLERPRSAGSPEPIAWVTDFLGVALLSAFAGLLVMFGLQRLSESGDIAGRLRAGGLRTIAELALPRRGKRPTFAHDPQAAQLAFALESAPGTEPAARFVIVGTDVRSSLAVVDAIRSGLEQAGMHGQRDVTLGPSLDDLPGLRAATIGPSACVAVLHFLQPVDRFLEDVADLVEAGIPFVGAVIVRDRSWRRARIDTASDARHHLLRPGGAPEVRA